MLVCKNDTSNQKNLSTLREYRQDTPTDIRIPAIIDYEFISSKLDNIFIEDMSDVFYCLPQDIKNRQTLLMSAHSTSNVFNQLNIRCDSWKIDEQNEFPKRKTLTIDTSRTTYFDSLITNRAMDYKWENGLTNRTRYQYGPFVPALEANSPLSNHLDFNCLIMSGDGYVPFVKRSKNVSIGKMTYGTSVGASLKAKYALNEDKKLTVEGIEYAVKNEILDELKIPFDDLKYFSLENNLLAAYRDLVEGGKPQFLFRLETKTTKQKINDNFLSIIEAAKQKQNDWDTEAKVLEDGEELVWLSVEELLEAAISEEHVVCGNRVLNVMPSTAASVELFVRYLRQQNKQ